MHRGVVLGGRGRCARSPGATAAIGVLAALLAAAGAGAARGHAAGAAAWQTWRHVPGVFDLAGPRSDGRLVVAAAGHLALMSSDGSLTAFAGGTGGYLGTPGAEEYIALSPGLGDSVDGCRFARDEVYVLDLGTVPGVVRVTPDGHAGRFASVPSAKTLGVIVFDTGGAFGHRLLVGGPVARGEGSVVVAIDCRGRVHPVATGAPAFEGGAAIAPAGFGSHGGDLIVPDEGSGRIIAISPGGDAVELAASGIATGGDIGVESVGAAPLSGAVLLADRATPGNLHPGTDSILRIGVPALTAAGVLPGDVLVASEGGAVTVDLRCSPQCGVRTVATGPPTAHAEGHLFSLGPVPADVASRQGGRNGRLVLGGVLSLLAGAMLVAATLALRRRWRGQRAS